MLGTKSLCGRCVVVRRFWLPFPQGTILHVTVASYTAPPIIIYSILQLVSCIILFNSTSCRVLPLFGCSKPLSFADRPAQWLHHV